MGKKAHLLSTAQFAELCDLEKSTLRFYRDRGVLAPSLIQGNGYGKYEPLQGLDIAHIKLLENCGFSLREIEERDRALFPDFPYDRILSLLQREQKSLSAKNVMLSVARLISALFEEYGSQPFTSLSCRQYFLFQEYSKPSEDIEYNLVHSIKLITRLSLEHLGTTPFVLGRVVRKEDLLQKKFNKVRGLIIPIPEELALSGEIPEENLFLREAAPSLRLCYCDEPFSFRQPFERVFRDIAENRQEIAGDCVELWTIGGRSELGTNTYTSLIDIPVADGKGRAL